MNASLLRKLKPIEKPNYESIFFNGTPIRVGIKEHFSRIELESYAASKLQYNFTNEPLVYYTYFENLKACKKTYAYLLAFYRRISLPLKDIFSAPINYKSHPINELRNFQVLDELFEKHYDSFKKLDTDNVRKKIAFKDKVTQVVFKLWLCGYGLEPTYTDNCINEEILDFLHKRKRNDGLSKVARFLGFMLSNEDFSPVKEAPKMQKNTSLKDRELAKWSTLLGQFNTEITRELFNFTFGSLRNRIGKSSFVEYTNKQGKLTRESLSSISDGTWVSYSGSLLKLAEILNDNEYFSRSDCLNKGINDVMTFEVPQLSQSTKDNLRIVCKHWVQWYTKINGIELNINRIIPPAIKHKDKSFGRMINYGAAVTLIETLLDDNCTYFDEQNISDFRARRACLLLLATGQRASEICYLMYDCLHDDNMEVTWLFLHKTKGNNSNKVIATPDIKQWVSELRKVAPLKKILISSNIHPYGDNLEEYRLLGNMFDDGPFLSSSMNNFLTRIQKKIWEDNHPNKSFFSSHDLRRMHALYMRLKGKSKNDIQDQLGHNNIDSQLPYLATKPLEHQKWFETIQLEGVYKNISSKESDDTIDLDKITDKTLELTTTKYDAEKITKLLIEITNDVDNFEIPKPNSSPLPTGFPLRIHSCNATTMINCGHTELHCFGCDYYTPDLDTLDDHKTEIFRYMTLVLYQDKESKKTKDILQREIISFRSKDMNELINKAFDELFVKFNLEIHEIRTIRNELEEKSLKYIKKYFKSKPNPSFKEAKFFLIKGEIIG